jgi:hypothetical protein
MNFLWSKRNARYRKPFGYSVCQDWNSRHDWSENLEAFNMYFIEDTTMPPGKTSSLKTHRLLRYHCRNSGLLAQNPLEKAVKAQGDKQLIETLRIR